MSWQPWNEQHAIERVGFSVFLDSPLNPKPFQRLLIKVQSKAANMGINEKIVLQQPIMHLQFSPPDPAIASPQFAPISDSGPMGQTFRKTESGRVLEEIVFTRNFLSFSATVYNRWSDFSQRVEECLSDAINKIIEDTNVIEVRIEYWDRFDFLTDNSQEGNKDSHLINPNSSLASPFLRRKKGSWHEHIGFFKDEGTNIRTLVNSNIDVIENSTGFPPVLDEKYLAQARFYTLTSVRTTAPNSGFEGWQSIKESMVSGHDLSKSIVGDLIHPDLAERIKLEARQLTI